MLPELADPPVPDHLICICADGVLAVGQDILFHHTEPVQEVANAYRPVFDCPSFLKTDALTEELTWLSRHQRDRDVLLGLGEPSLPLKCWSFIEILAATAAEAIVALEARGCGEVGFFGRLRALRWCLLDLYRESKDKSVLPALPSPVDIASCGCATDFHHEGIFIDGDGKWKKGQAEKLPSGVLTFRASAEQMLWLAQYPDFSQVLGALQDRYGTTEMKMENFLALRAALTVAIFRAPVENWLTAINAFIWDLERMLVDGMIYAEP